ncbi:MAG: hypothetical protein D6723_16675 [Acidobacteria bacterium]|nr:MAG: hypothetical protein D6723_16675 [Acidobacteriota bacterium]
MERTPIPNDRADDIDAGSELPFDIRTFLLGLLRRWPIVVISTILFAALGVAGALLFGSRTYKAETVLLYKPSSVAGVENDLYVPPPLPTQLHLVKLQSNLEEVRRRLKLPATLKALGAACDVVVERKTNLMIIRVEWDSPDMAAAIANTLRDVFLENQRRLRRTEVGKDLRDLEKRLEAIRQQLKKADAALKEFTTTHNVVDLEQETQWYLDELTSIELLLEQAQVEKKTIEKQMKNLDRIIEDLKRRVAKEQAQSAQLEALSDVNLRIQRLRELIQEDKQYRARLAELTQKELELERAKKLLAEGLISEVEFGKIKADYERQKALTIDTDQIKQWKAEMERLDRVVVPNQNGLTPSGEILQDMMRKAFDLQLQHVAVADKVEHLNEARARIKARLDALPALQREYVALNREVQSLENEKQQLENVLVKVRRVYESEASDFTIISEARPPVLPSQSNRKLIFLGIAALGPLMGLFIIVLLELADMTIKSGSELSIRLGVPVLGVLPRLPAGRQLIPGKVESELIEAFKIIARRIRYAVPKRGARLLIVSAQHGEGKTSLAANLAACLGRMDERVLLIDAQVRSGSQPPSLAQMLLAEESARNGNGRRPLTPIEAVFLQPVQNFAQFIRRTIPEKAWRTLPQITQRHPRLAATAARVKDWFHHRFEQMRSLHPPTGVAGQHHTLRELITNGHQSLKGLGEYLSFEADQPDDVIWPTVLAGVECVPRIKEPVIPDLLGSRRMQALLDEVSSRFSLILIDAPPVLPYVDAELLAPWCDAVIFVVRSRMCRVGTLRRALDRLRATGAPIIGALLNGVDPLYLEEM